MSESSDSYGIENGLFPPDAGHDKEKRNTQQNPETDKQKVECIVKRVMYVLTELVGKLKVALVLPELVKDPESLKEFMPQEDINQLLSYCNKYMRPEEKFEDTTVEVKIMFDYNLLKAIDLVYKNPYINHRIPDYLENLSCVSKGLLEDIIDVYKIAELRFNTHASSEIFRENVLHWAYRDNKNFTESISENQLKLHVKKRSLTELRAQRRSVLTEYQENLKRIHSQHLINIQKEIRTANRINNELCDASDLRKIRLEEDLKQAKRAYKRVLTENLMAEKKLREKKTRILSQLASWVKKYDTDMRDKTLEIERLKKILVEKTEELDNFMEEYNRQKDEYYQIITAKEEQEAEAYEIRKMEFMMNRAARIIQRAWRRYKKWKKMQKKKKGKGKKKKAPKVGKVAKEDVETDKKDKKESKKKGKQKIEKKSEEIAEEPVKEAKSTEETKGKEGSEKIRIPSHESENKQNELQEKEVDEQKEKTTEKQEKAETEEIKETGEIEEVKNKDENAEKTEKIVEEAVKETGHIEETKSKEKSKKIKIQSQESEDRQNELQEKEVDEQKEKATEKQERAETEKIKESEEIEEARNEDANPEKSGKIVEKAVKETGHMEETKDKEESMETRKESEDKQREIQEKETVEEKEKTTEKQAVETGEVVKEKEKNEGKSAEEGEKQREGIDDVQKDEKKEEEEEEKKD